MKHKIIWHVTTTGQNFQFLWGWNINTAGSSSGATTAAFNSFEDETRALAEKPTVRALSFQFLWGWNRGSNDPPLGAQRQGFQFLWGWNSCFTGGREIAFIDFQFLWGWNRVQWTSPRCAMTSVTFNSFEDETVLNEWRRPGSSFTFQFLWGWNRNLLLDTISQNTTFNSFEDETRRPAHSVDRNWWKFFQFLWGWNWSTFILSFML